MEPVYGIIYRVTHPDSGKSYIGQSRNERKPCSPEAHFRRRWNAHMYDVRRGVNDRFHNAIRKDGPDAFEHEIVRVCNTRAELNEWEKHYIAEENLCEVGYNIKAGGDAHDQAPETCEKIGDALRGIPKTESHCARLSEAALNRVYENPEERNRAISLGLAGKSKSPEHVEKVAAKNRGRTHTDEARANMAAAHVGKTQSIETIQKRVAKLRGQKRTQETRAILSKQKQKLTDEQLVEIREKSGTVRNTDLAAEYGVSKATIYNIVARKGAYTKR